MMTRGFEVEEETCIESLTGKINDWTKDCDKNCKSKYGPKAVGEKHIFNSCWCKYPCSGLPPPAPKHP